MAEVRSSIRRTTRVGNEHGVRVTELDRQRLALLARWYCLSIEHLARAEEDPALWSPAHPASSTPEAQAQWHARVRSVYQRLWKLKGITADASRNLGPLADATLAHDGKTAWFTTRYGATAAGVPWRMRSAINPLFAAHSWMAADIGMALEARGHHVLSERELSTGIDRNGDRIDTRIESQYTTKQGGEINKKPDVAVLDNASGRYIAIECERDKSRSVKVYEQKLAAYRANSDVHAVWYICASQVTARRVMQGAERVFGGDRSYPLRVVVNEQVNGFHFLDMDTLGERLHSDLAFGARQ